MVMTCGTDGGFYITIKSSERCAVKDNEWWRSQMMVDVPRALTVNFTVLVQVRFALDILYVSLPYRPFTTRWFRSFSQSKSVKKRNPRSHWPQYWLVVCSHWRVSPPSYPFLPPSSAHPHSCLNDTPSNRKQWPIKSVALARQRQQRVSPGKKRRPLGFDRVPPSFPPRDPISSNAGSWGPNTRYHGE